MSNNNVIIEDEDFTEYDYDPYFMEKLIYHLRIGGSNFMFLQLQKYFPNFTILQTTYPRFQREIFERFNLDKSKFIRRVLICDDIFCDLLLKPENQEIREKILDTKIGLISEKFNDFMECAEFIRTIIYHRRLYKCDNQVWLKQLDGRWIITETEIKQQIQSFILNNDIRMLKNANSEELMYAKIKRMSPAKEIVEMVIMDLKDDRTLQKKLWNETKGMLNFLNCTYDFSDDTIYTERSGTLHMINRNFNRNSNPKVREELMRRIFRPIFTMDDSPDGEVNFKYFMYCVARMIAGDIEDKRILLLTGSRDCGKGMLGTLIENTIDEYSFAMDLGAFKSGRNSSDQAKENSWLIPLQFRRVAIMNENSDCKLDGNKMKQFGSGGDSFMCRSNYKDEIQIKIQTSGIIMANETPQFNTSDVYEKIEQISLVSKFLNESFPESDKLHKIKYYPNDNTLKSKFLQRPEVLNEFMIMLIEAYPTNMKTPESVLKERNDDDNEYDKLREGFKINEASSITNKEMMEKAKRLGINKKQNDIKKLLKNVFGESIDTAYRTSTFRGIKGLEIIQDIM